MKYKELLTVIDSSAYLNVVSEGGLWIQEGRVVLDIPDLLERKVKNVDIIRNEFFITVED